MQIEADQSSCPVCGAARLVSSPVIHHMVCAYVGPQFDFEEMSAGLTCPKCRRELRASDAEIVGTSARCANCHAEMMVSPPAA